MEREISKSWGDEGLELLFLMMSRKGAFAKFHSLTTSASPLKNIFKGPRCFFVRSVQGFACFSNSKGIPDDAVFIGSFCIAHHGLARGGPHVSVETADNGCLHES